MADIVDGADEWKGLLVSIKFPEMKLDGNGVAELVFTPQGALALAATLQTGAAEAMNAMRRSEALARAGKIG